MRRTIPAAALLLLAAALPVLAADPPAAQFNDPLLRVIRSAPPPVAYVAEKPGSSKSVLLRAAADAAGEAVLSGLPVVAGLVRDAASRPAPATPPSKSVRKALDQARRARAGSTLR